MLYHIEDSSWKISDFALGFEGIERRNQTQFTAQSASYRAPEIVSMNRSTSPRFNNKVDIWALGCIFHDVLTGERAFSDDRAVLHYDSDNATLSFSALNHKSLDDRALCVLTQFCKAMLRVNEYKRPTAEHVLNALLWNTCWEKSVIWISECNHYPHLFIDMFVAPRYHSMWKEVTLQQDRDNGLIAQTNCSKKSASERVVTPKDQGWRFVLSDTERSCVVQQWLPINIPLKAPWLPCRRRVIQTRALSKIHQVSRLDIGTALKSVSNFERRIGLGRLASFLTDSSSNILCLKIVNGSSTLGY